MSDRPDQSVPDESLELLPRFCRELESGTVQSVIDFCAKTELELTLPQTLALIQAEIGISKTKGQNVRVEDYFDAFPGLADYLSQQTSTDQLIHEPTAFATEVAEFGGGSNTRQIVSPGDKLDDFELLAELGRGSFATVFLARQVSMQRLVALKVSADHGLEAQTLAQLDHRNIVRVFDQRRDKEFNLHLLYMQYLEGGTLQGVFEKIQNVPADQLTGKLFVQCVDEAILARGASPNYESTTRKRFEDSTWEQTICLIGLQLAKALHYAHQKGVLHRDIKPANVLVGNDCSVKLADFNVSSADTVTGDSKFGGSLAYMSPEQIRVFNRNADSGSGSLDGRSDIYSLAVMFHQLLLRRLPFDAFTHSRSSEGLREMVAERENSIDQIASGLQHTTPLLRSALIRSLQPKPADRPASAAELANQLKIGTDPEVETLLFPELSRWRRALQSQFLLICFVAICAFNGLAAAFVFNFNLADAVPDEAKSIFRNISRTINGIFFPLALVTFIYLTWVIPKAIRLCQRNRSSDVPDMPTVMHRTLQVGHVQALICCALWLAAGVLYPLCLTLFGVSLTTSDWLDFIASHWLAGISITTLAFFATTYLSLRVWLPVLIEGSYGSQVITTVCDSLRSLIAKVHWYQFLAVAVPLLAIALLVMIGDTMVRSKFPLRVISVFGLLTIPIVMFGGNRIRSICERLLTVFSNK